MKNLDWKTPLATVILAAILGTTFIMLNNPIERNEETIRSVDIADRELILEQTTTLKSLVDETYIVHTRVVVYPDYAVEAHEIESVHKSKLDSLKSVQLEIIEPKFQKIQSALTQKLQKNE